MLCANLGLLAVELADSPPALLLLMLARKALVLNLTMTRASSLGACQFGGGRRGVPFSAASAAAAAQAKIAHSAGRPSFTSLRGAFMAGSLGTASARNWLVGGKFARLYTSHYASHIHMKKGPEGPLSATAAALARQLMRRFSQR
jgi:hypothetical protein